MDLGCLHLMLKIPTRAAKNANFAIVKLREIKRANKISISAITQL